MAINIKVIPTIEIISIGHKVKTASKRECTYIMKPNNITNNFSNSEIALIDYKLQTSSDYSSLLKGITTEEDNRCLSYARVTFKLAEPLSIDADLSLTINTSASINTGANIRGGRTSDTAIQAFSLVSPTGATINKILGEYGTGTSCTYANATAAVASGAYTISRLAADSINDPSITELPLTIIYPIHFDKEIWDIKDSVYYENSANYKPSTTVRLSDYLNSESGYLPPIELIAKLTSCSVISNNSNYAVSLLTESDLYNNHAVTCTITGSDGTNSYVQKHSPYIKGVFSSTSAYTMCSAYLVNNPANVSVNVSANTLKVDMYGNTTINLYDLKDITEFPEDIYKKIPGKHGEYNTDIQGVLHITYNDLNNLFTSPYINYLGGLATLYNTHLADASMYTNIYTNTKTIYTGNTVTPKFSNCDKYNAYNTDYTSIEFDIGTSVLATPSPDMSIVPTIDYTYPYYDSNWGTGIYSNSSNLHLYSKLLAPGTNYSGRDLEFVVISSLAYLFMEKSKGYIAEAIGIAPTYDYRYFVNLNALSNLGHYSIVDKSKTISNIISSGQNNVSNNLLTIPVTYPVYSDSLRTPLMNIVTASTVEVYYGRGYGSLSSISLYSPEDIYLHGVRVIPRSIRTFIDDGGNSYFGFTDTTTSSINVDYDRKVNPDATITVDVTPKVGMYPQGIMSVDSTKAVYGDAVFKYISTEVSTDTLFELTFSDLLSKASFDNIDISLGTATFGWDELLIKDVSKEAVIAIPLYSVTTGTIELVFDDHVRISGGINSAFEGLLIYGYNSITDTITSTFMNSSINGKVVLPKGRYTHIKVHYPHSKNFYEFDVTSGGTLATVEETMLTTRQLCSFHSDTVVLEITPVIYTELVVGSIANTSSIDTKFPFSVVFPSTQISGALDKHITTLFIDTVNPITCEFITASSSDFSSTDKTLVGLLDDFSHTYGVKCSNVNKEKVRDTQVTTVFQLDNTSSIINFISNKELSDNLALSNPVDFVSRETTIGEVSEIAQYNVDLSPIAIQDTLGHTGTSVIGSIKLYINEGADKLAEIPLRINTDFGAEPFYKGFIASFYQLYSYIFTINAGTAVDITSTSLIPIENSPDIAEFDVFNDGVDYREAAMNEKFKFIVDDITISECTLEGYIIGYIDTVDVSNASIDSKLSDAVITVTNTDSVARRVKLTVAARYIG